MLRVYAQFRLFLIIFSILISSLLLTGCGAGGYYSSWGLPNTGVVTSDPESLPNIGWQTRDQRQVLVEQNKAVNEEQQQQQGGLNEQEKVTLAPPAAKEEAAPAAPATHEKITVSILLPLSGNKSALGQSMLKAAQMALFDIGSANFELVPRDTKSTTDGAVAAAQAALDDHSALILGPIFADDLKAIKPIVSPTNTPIISFTTDWTLAGNDTYIMGFLPFTQVMRVVRYAQDHGYSRLAVYAPQTEYCDVVIRTLEKSGISIVRTSRYPANQSELGLAVKEFADASRIDNSHFDFDTLMLPLGSEGLRSLVTNLNNKGIDQSKVKFIGTGLWDDSTLLNYPALYGGWFSAPDPNLRADFEKRFRDSYEVAPMRLASLAYDATALAAVLARTATNGSPYTFDAITNPRGFAGIDGIFRFRSDGLNERGLAVLEIRSGKLKVVDPAPTAFISSGS